MHKFAGFLAILQITCNLYYTILYHKPVLIRITGFLRDDYIEKYSKATNNPDYYFKEPIFFDEEESIFITEHPCVNENIFIS